MDTPTNSRLLTTFRRKAAVACGISALGAALLAHDDRDRLFRCQAGGRLRRGVDRNIIRQFFWHLAANFR